MPARARPWSGDPPPRHLTSYYDRLRQALRRPLELGLAAAIGVMDQPCCRTAHGQGFAQSGKSQVAMQPVAGCPANDPACEQVDNDGEVEPAFAGPHIGDVGAPLLIGRCCLEVLIEQVRRDWPGVMAVRGPLEPPLLPSPQAVVAHQPGYPAATDHQAGVLQFPRHPGTAIGGIREGKGRPDMRQQHHVVALAAAGWPTSPGEIAALAAPSMRHRRWTGNSAFAPSMSANLTDFPPGRKKRWPSSGCPAPAEGFRSPDAAASAPP